jgi:four helix bundle protein
MGVKRIEDLIAWQLAVEFKGEVHRLIAGSKLAQRDFLFVTQLCNALVGTESNTVEGFHRNRTREFAQFLRYARSSHAEAETRLKDGIARGYFKHADCEKALHLAKRCGQALLRLLQSLEPFMGPDPKPRRPRRPERPTRRDGLTEPGPAGPEDLMDLPDPPDPSDPM